MCIMEHIPCKADQDLNEIKTSVNQIKDALLGTDFNQRQGLVYQVEKNKEEIGEVKKKYEKIEKKLYYYTGFSAATGLIVGYIIKKLIEI